MSQPASPQSNESLDDLQPDGPSELDGLDEPSKLDGSSGLDGPSELVQLPEPPILPSSKLLVNDVILDGILTELDVPDILKLRQVNSQYRLCSTEPVVWKRILARAEHRLPPVPPTARYTFPNLSGIEAERLLTRAVSLPLQWEKKELECLRRWDIEAHRRVLEMTLLPGGQYLVASVADRSGTRYSIEVFTSDFKYSTGMPLARLSVPTKAFDLRAKYVTLQGRPGILVVYVRRDYRRERYKERFDINALPSDWSHAHGASWVKYECTAAHIPLDSLELLGTESRPDDLREFWTLALKQRRPFQILTEITSRSRISNPVIDEDMFGVPFVAVLKHNPSRIVYKNLDGGPGHTMTCALHPALLDLPHSIMAFMILPLQKQFLVVRRAGADSARDTTDGLFDPEGPFYFLELYDIIYKPAATVPTTVECEPASRGAVHASAGDFWHKVWISEPAPGPREHPLSPGRHPHPGPPPPITVFVRSARAYGITYEPIMPVLVPSASEPDEKVYAYVLDEDNTRWMEHEPLPEGIQGLADLYEHHVLPGAARPLVYSLAHRAAVRTVGGIWDERLLAAVRREEPVAASGAGGEEGNGDGEAGGAANEQEGEGNEEQVSQADSQQDGPSNARPLKLEQEELTNVSAMAWDETIGRLCVGYAKETRIAVFDLAGAPLRTLA